MFDYKKNFIEKLFKKRREKEEKIFDFKELFAERVWSILLAKIVSSPKLTEMSPI